MRNANDPAKLPYDNGSPPYDPKNLKTWMLGYANARVSRYPQFNRPESLSLEETREWNWEVYQIIADACSGKLRYAYHWWRSWWVRPLLRRPPYNKQAEIQIGFLNQYRNARVRAEEKTMEKRAVVQPGTTRDTEDKLTGEKQASEQAKVEALDDDVTKRLADGFDKPKAED